MTTNFANTNARNCNATKCDDGFTLLEMLIALALLALITMLILTAIQGTGRALSVADRQLGEASTSAAQFVVRQAISQMQPNKLSGDRSDNAPMIQASSAKLRMITNSTAGGQYSGFYDTELTALPSGSRPSQLDLVLRQMPFRRVGLEAKTEPAKSLSATLFKNITTVSLRYFGRLEVDKPPAWYQSWTSPNRLPSLIAIDVTLPKGDTRIWPTLYVVVRAAS
jgi:prepilin-type N-terminal cleavage/methylation domain-containing protein